MTGKFELYGVKDWLNDEYSDKIEVPLIRVYTKAHSPEPSISRQQEIKYILKLASEMEVEKLRTTEYEDSIYHNIAKRIHIEIIQKGKDEDNYSHLIRLCLGKQLFDYIASEFFPRKNSFDYYLARFYSCVVLRRVDEARYIYSEIYAHLDKIICKKILPNSQVIGNIRCLFYLLINKKHPDEILEENMSLIDMSKDIKNDAMCSILLLNRSRLFRSMQKYKLALEALNQSHEIITRNKLWKQSFYYILQQSMISQEKEQLVNICLEKDFSQHIQHDWFGWRVAKLLTGKSCYAYRLYTVPEGIKDILSSEYSLEEKYKLIKEFRQKSIYAL
jgi:tetratricopeptide (TPR) repeat protein